MDVDGLISSIQSRRDVFDNVLNRRLLDPLGAPRKIILDAEHDYNPPVPSLLRSSVPSFTHCLGPSQV